MLNNSLKDSTTMENEFNQLKNYKYYGKLLVNGYDTLLAKIEGDNNIREAKIFKMTVTFDKCEKPHASLLANIGGIGKIPIRVKFLDDEVSFWLTGDIPIRFYGTLADASLGNATKEIYLPSTEYSAFSNLFQRHGKEYLFIKESKGNGVYRYEWDGSSPKMSFYSINANEPIIVDEYGWKYQDEALNDEVENWLCKTYESREDAYEANKDSIKVIAIEDTETSDKTESEIPEPTDDYETLKSEAIDVINRILNYYHIL